MAKPLLSLRHHAVAYDQAVAVLRVALEAEQADRLSFGERDRLAEVEQGFGLLHMLQENALEAFGVSGARRVTTTLRRA
ncbi:MAG TPA: hypothetical protein VF090_08765, partial [Methyloceanibacter sp.]